MQRLTLFFLIAISVFGVFAPLPTVQAQSNSLAYSPAALFIWTDKYVYTPGEPLTLRWTARANGDTAPYTVFIYRQNNQTGAKTYFPANSTAATDIVGKTSGYTTFYLGDVTKSVVIGSGGWLSQSFSAPNELGMHTFVVQLRDATGSRVIKSAYFKFGVVSGFDDVTGNIDSDRTFTNTRAYRLKGIVNVKNNAVLTIEPGTFVIGQPGSQPPSVLVVTRTGRIQASGTRARPIIMTSSQPFGQRKRGDWGGLILLGNAPINVAGGTAFIEGLTANDDLKYGGTDPNHSCGALEYVRVEYAGAEFQPNSEVNSITWGGCGKATVANHLETRYGFDDAFEWFGGNMDAKYLVGQSVHDDYIDAQLGWTGRLQFAVGVAGKDEYGNSGMEMDNSEFDHTASPRTHPQVYNLTFVGAGDTVLTGADDPNSSGAWFRRGLGGSYNNIILYNWIVNGITVRDAETVNEFNRGGLTMNGIMMFDNGKAGNKANTVDGQVSGSGNLGLPLVTASPNIVVANPQLRRPLYTSDPDFRPLPGSPVFSANWVQPPDDGFFDQSATYSGAFGDVDWTEEWTVFHLEADLQ